MRSAVGSLRRLDDGPTNKPGRWEIRYAGHSKVHRGTRKTAAQALSLMVATISGRPPPDSAALGDVIADRIEHLTGQRSPTTIDGYQRLLDRNVKPDPIAKVNIDKLTAGQLERFYKTLGTPGKVRPTHRLIAAALAQALRSGWVDRNVALQIQIAGPIRHRRVLPPFDLLAAALEDQDERDPDLGCLFRVAAATGMRRGELCGLEWGDVAPGRLIIRHNLVRTRADGLVRKATKTHSERAKHLGPVTVAALDGRRSRAEQWAATVGHEVGPEDLVWTRARTRKKSGPVPYDPDAVSHAWRVLADAHGLQGVRLHDLRHLYGTRLLAAGFTIADVADELGHASPLVTAGVYVHGTDRGEDAAKVIEALMAGE